MQNPADRGAESRGVCPRREDAPGCALGLLTAAEREAFETHAAVCGECAAALAAAREVFTRLRAEPDRECPAGMAERILEQRQAVLRFPERWFAVARRAAALLVAAGLGWLMWRQINAPAPDREVAWDSLAGARAWLCAQQGADGSWRSGAAAEGQYDVGVSALALLALMGNPGGAVPGDSAAALRRGCDYLAASQSPDGRFGPSVAAAPYNHGLATLALVNACGVESNAAWRAAVTRGLRFIIETQDPAGGWNYLGEGPGRVNSSASVWPLMALRRAAAAGFPIPRLAIARGMAWLRSAVGDDGLMGYEGAGQSPYGFDTLTLAGAFCLFDGSEPADRRLAARMLPSVRRLADEPRGREDYYRAFFLVRALSLARAAGLEPARAKVAAGLGELQRRAGPDAGSWAPDTRWGSVGGSVYSTALASMSVR
jgi:hypothetical protein